jgi:hypothetical protein
MTTWTLTYNGVEKSPADWGVDTASVSYVNQASDSLDLVFNGLPFDADLPFAFDQFVTLKRYDNSGHGTTVFIGRVAACPRYGEPTRESITVSILGPWQELEETYFNQLWNSNGGTGTVQISAIIMGQDITGARQDCAACVTEIMNYAHTTCGLNVQLGTNMNPISIPFDEVRVQTIAALLRRYLAYQPSALTYFNYTTTPPTLNVVDRSVGTPLAYALRSVNPASPLSIISPITARPDLVIGGVSITYIISESINGSSGWTPSIDTYPPNANPASRRVLCGEFDLDGGSTNATQQTQYIKTTPLPSDYSDLTFWKRHINWMNDAAYGNVTVDNSTVQTTFDWGDGSTTQFYSNELIGGTFQEWMEHETSPALHTVTGKVRASCTYTYTQPKTNAQETKTCTVEASVISTNAATGTYQSQPTITTNPGQSPPVGLAQAFYDSMSTLQYDGVVKLVEAEAMTTLIRPGMVLNIIGGRAEWETMNAQIQQVKIDIATGTTSITIGVAKHLGKDTLLKIMQPIRIQIQPANDQSRVTGNSKNANNTVSGTGSVPTDAGSKGAGIASRTDWADPTDTTNSKSVSIDTSQTNTAIITIKKQGSPLKTIIISTGDIPDACTSTIRLQALDYCTPTGPAQKILVLCSSPYAAS